MADSIYAYLYPETAQTENEYFKNYFSEHPWALKPDSEDGKDVLFVWVKPRFSEKGLTRFIPFMDAIRDIKRLVHKIVPDDTLEGDKLEQTMIDNGYGDLVELVVRTSA